jgi:hypothetical protein
MLVIRDHVTGLLYIIVDDLETAPSHVFAAKITVITESATTFYPRIFRYPSSIGSAYLHMVVFTIKKPGLGRVVVPIKVISKAACID